MYVKCVSHGMLHGFELAVNEAIQEIKSTHWREDRNVVILDVKYLKGESGFYAFIEWDFICEDEVPYD